MFLALTLSGVGVQIAGFLLHDGLLPLALLMAMMILLSMLLQKTQPLLEHAKNQE